MSVLMYKTLIITYMLSVFGSLIAFAISAYNLYFNDLMFSTFDFFNLGFLTHFLFMIFVQSKYLNTINGDYNG